MRSLANATRKSLQVNDNIGDIYSMKLSKFGFNWLYGFEKKNQLIDRICTNQILMSPGWVLGLRPQNTAPRIQQVKYHFQKSSPTKNPTNSSNVRFLFPYFRFTPFRRVCETRNLPPPPLSKRNDGWGGNQCTRVPHEDGGRGLCVCLRTATSPTTSGQAVKIVDNGVGERVVCVSSDPPNLQPPLVRQQQQHQQCRISATTHIRISATTHIRIFLISQQSSSDPAWYVSSPLLRKL